MPTREPERATGVGEHQIERGVDVLRRPHEARYRSESRPRERHRVAWSQLHPLTRTDRLRFLHYYFAWEKKAWDHRKRWIAEVMRISIERARSLAHMITWSL